MGLPLCFFLVLLLSVCCKTVPIGEEGRPVPINPSDDVCTVKNLTYSRGEEVPDVSPCETCLCQPPDVKCSAVKCQPNTGCRILQQPNTCCPVYKCDCEYSGKVYNNGEKLDNPLSPCQVCYCRGGEIMCNSITCYIRDDCEPRHVEGQCCPKYEHCPPKNSSAVVAVPADTIGSSTKREMQPWLLTKSVNLQTTETVSKYPQTIKIMEILPTQSPSRNGEVSLIPRIITNGVPDSKLASSPEPPTGSYQEDTSSPVSTGQLLHSPQSDATEDNESPQPMSDATEDIESPQPDSQRYTTLLPHMVDVTREYEELAQLSNGGTEGTGYDLEAGGTFYPTTKKDDDSSEESGTQSAIVTNSSEENSSESKEEKDSPNFELVEGTPVENRTLSANLKEETAINGLEDSSTENTAEVVLTSQSGSSSVVDADSMTTVTRHGFTIPPVIDLNQIGHLTLGGTGEEADAKSVAKIGIYDPTKPDEISSLVTVIKTDESSSGATATSVEGRTTQMLLTPDDLKTLAEMMIKEKIKVVNEKLEMGTTPLPTESTQESIMVSSVELSEEANYTTGVPGEPTAEETTTPHPSETLGSTQLHNLTKEEEKAQKVLDRVTSNLLLPLQGIDLVEASNTTDLPTSPEPLTDEKILLGNKDAEWVDVSNATQSELIEDDSTTTVPSEESNSTVDQANVTVEFDDHSNSTSTTEGVEKSRGTLRQMVEPSVESKKAAPKESAIDRRHSTSSGNQQKRHSPMAILDENDRLLVANFFRKALNFQ